MLQVGCHCGFDPIKGLRPLIFGWCSQAKPSRRQPVSQLLWIGGTWWNLQQGLVTSKSTCQPVRVHLDSISWWNAWSHWTDQCVLSIQNVKTLDVEFQLCSGNQRQYLQRRVLCRLHYIDQLRSWFYVWHSAQTSRFQDTLRWRKWFHNQFAWF